LRLHGSILSHKHGRQVQNTDELPGNRTKPPHPKTNWTHNSSVILSGRMDRSLLALLAALWALPVLAQSQIETNVQSLLRDLVRLASVNPPGGETRTARYLEGTARKAGIECELLGDDPQRLNFVARLHGSGAQRPLLLMAHSDVVPADPKQWTFDPFSAELHDGFIYGRGTVDTLGLLAAEMAVLLELQASQVTLSRDVILLSESDEEAGSTGIQWMIRNAWPKIDAEFALNEGGNWSHLGGVAVFRIQTAEKIPARAVLTAHGTAGHGSLPRADNPVVHLARAIARLADADQPVRLNPTTRRYFNEMARLPAYAWLLPLLPELEKPQSAPAAARRIREHEPELAAQLQTTVSPTMLSAGVKINVVPNAAEARVDVRRLPSEPRDEVYQRFRRIIDDPAVTVEPEQGQQMPDTEPSSMTTDLYRAMEQVFQETSPGARVVPFMLLGATDGSFLRAKGMAVYGVPVFDIPRAESRAHGNDERLAVENLSRGSRLLLQIVKKVCVQ
jgi:acetylornithine deacetylase/succinyl-diaminopimelate desuccinylase-like protein